ncbi:SAP domain-containing protein [Dellaglioa carnosa]|uniref:SAP domain-containing protein n=1 Tax=Dellaglioa carnosa TaxID=2995136 RepID=UPI0022A889B2|nr:SAP domain-containing protein [Dellaglioa carnosa]MCZ2492657.1 SAP domain-containing protein [Dellaglioa carnosa]
MTIRPDFNKNMTSETFKSYYWYKVELEQVCRNYLLPHFGTKAELTQYIILFLEGEKAENINPTRKIRRQTSTALTANLITSKTKLLNSGFSLNNEARKFFANYFGVQKFSFRKSMGIKMREAEKTADINATVADLIKVFNINLNNSINNNEEKTYQWNNFVKDFFNDSISKEYSSPMKVAAILWKTVRDSNRDKKYSRELVIKNKVLIAEFLK